jgi:hypothetical protein
MYTAWMDAAAQEALGTVRWCVVRDRLTVLPHFLERMEERGMVWPDVLAILDDPESVRDGGPEKFNRPKWIFSGTAADGLPVELVCVLDEDENGDWVLFITIY